ncbi:MAG: hypothetical protein ACTSW1_19245 [Candidatus Hodarchaeales archaeon]
MSRFFRFFKRLFVPELSHDAAQEAQTRDEISQKITDDQIYVQTVRNALNVPDASIQDKLTFAFSSLPESMTNFEYSKSLFIDIIEFLLANKEITPAEVMIYKNKIKDINSLEELMTLANE